MPAIWWCTVAEFVLGYTSNSNHEMNIIKINTAPHGPDLTDFVIAWAYNSMRFTQGNIFSFSCELRYYVL